MKGFLKSNIRQVLLNSVVHLKHMSVLGKRKKPGDYLLDQQVLQESESEDDDLECKKMIYEKMTKDIND